MTLLFFSLSGLDVLDAIDLSPARKSEIIDWIYAQQILPDSINSGIICNYMLSQANNNYIFSSQIMTRYVVSEALHFSECLILPMEKLDFFIV